MAKYTQLLAEYLEDGGELPAVFSDIEGFKDAFIGEYADCEIGFETPVLFTLKLNTRANVVIPLYSARIADLDTIRDIILNPNKKRIKTGELQRSRNGEIIRLTAGNKVVTVNTKSGTQTVTDEGADTTGYGATGTETYNENVEVYDEPFALAQDATDIPRAQPQQVTQTTKPITKVARENTQTTGYNAYEDKTEQNNPEEKTTEQYQGLNDTEDYRDITDSETGFTPTEALAIEASLRENKLNIIQECLNEFSSLFMEVY